MNKPFYLCYETFGSFANPCIILIAGIGGQLTDWPSSFIQELVAKGFYVVVFDNRDAGLSRHYDELGIPDIKEAIFAIQQGKPFSLPYALENLAEDVIALMDHLNIKKAHILGASMGGIIAQYVAINFANRVLSLICISSTSGDSHLPQAKKEVLDFFAQSFNGDDKERSVESFMNDKIKLFRIYNHPDYFDENVTRNQLTASFKRAHYPPGFKRLLLAMITAKPRTEQLKKLKLPCLIIHGDYDPVFPIEHGIQLSEIISGSHLEVIKNMGHALTDQFAKKVAEKIIKYLE